MPALARSATRSEARRTASQESPRNRPRARSPCSSPPSKRSRRKPWASTRSSLISMTGTSWGFIRGSFCGIGARARIARRRGRQVRQCEHRQRARSGQRDAASCVYTVSCRNVACNVSTVTGQSQQREARKCDGPDFSGPNNSWVLTAPCDSFSIERHSSQSSYFCREAIPAFAPHRTCAQRTERGPDGIRTRICDRRRVLCSHYTTGPERVYLRLAESSRSDVTIEPACVFQKRNQADESL